MSQAKFAEIETLGERNRIYASEILYRAHFGASAALLRLREWFTGAHRALEDRNVVILASAIRGFLETVADTFDALEDVPMTLAESHVVLRKAIAGDLDHLLMMPETESDLIHFAYARRLEPEDNAPQLHDAKTAASTISSLEESIPEVKNFYAALCQYSHPASPTVLRYATRHADRELLTFDPTAGDANIRELVGLSASLGPALVCGIAPCLMILKVLNALGPREVATPWADTLSLDFSDAWRTIEARLADAAGPRTPSDEEVERVTTKLFAAYCVFRPR
jgi:hypothetical protein